MTSPRDRPSALLFPAFFALCFRVSQRQGLFPNAPRARVPISTVQEQTANTIPAAEEALAGPGAGSGGRRNVPAPSVAGLIGRRGRTEAVPEVEYHSTREPAPPERDNPAPTSSATRSRLTIERSRGAA